MCRLKKALYGLKQAPRAWFQRLSTLLVTLGLYCSRADTSLFVLKRGSTLLYLLVYVDDIILTGNDPAIIRTFISRLNNEFATKDLGTLSYFLGLEASYTDDGLFLTQANYAHDILTRVGLLDAKPTTTPLSPTDQFLTAVNFFPTPLFIAPWLVLFSILPSLDLTFLMRLIRSASFFKHQLMIIFRLLNELCVM